MEHVMLGQHSWESSLLNLSQLHPVLPKPTDNQIKQKTRTAEATVSLLCGSWCHPVNFLCTLPTFLCVADSWQPFHRDLWKFLYLLENFNNFYGQLFLSPVYHSLLPIGKFVVLWLQIRDHLCAKVAFHKPFLSVFSLSHQILCILFSLYVGGRLKFPEMTKS